MNARDATKDVVRLLTQMAGGKLEAKLDGVPLATIDAEARNVTLDIGGLEKEDIKARSHVKEGIVNLWQARGVGGELARAGWHVSVTSEQKEIVRAGRDVSVLTGHVYVSPAAFRKIRKLL